MGLPALPCLARAVALLTEGVGRNQRLDFGGPVRRQSPSSRRAWLEIIMHHIPPACARGVALLTEGVGRNQLRHHAVPDIGAVALLTEGVGRNCSQAAISSASCTVPAP